ncbi:MAG: hypothetical protein IKN63_03530 [Bacilli bacterium]|nr:hypothetical protein [Bacilli bacterium]
MENKLKEICRLSLDIFTIIKEEYSIYLSPEKGKFLANLNIDNFYKIINKASLPEIFFMGDKYYLNSYYNFNNIEKLIPFLCLSSLITNLNPLKIGLIEVELSYLKNKYNLDIDTYFVKELEVANLVNEAMLINVPYKVIFKESDSDIFSYLTEELGSNYAICYNNVSLAMKKIWGNRNYFKEHKEIDYLEVIDYIYTFIINKVK